MLEPLDANLDPMTWLFLIFHCLSIACALLTYWIMSTPSDSSAYLPSPSSPAKTTTTAAKSNTLMHIMSRTYVSDGSSGSSASASQQRSNGNSMTSPSHRILQMSCINSIAMSLFILLPAFVYDFDLSNAPQFLCWTQGFLLQYVFIAQHMIMLVLTVHTWLLLVRWDFDAESRYRKVYWLGMVGVPALIVTVTFVGWMIVTHGTMHPMLPNYGITPRAGYCFFNRPIWVRLMTFVGWYLLAATPGVILSFWIVIYLYTTRHAQQRAFQRSVSDVNALSYRKLYRTISRSTLYRTVFFALIYTLGASLSYIPSLAKLATALRLESQGKDDTYLVDSKQLQFSEFSSAVAGIGMFIVFGTGQHAMHVFRKVWFDVKRCWRPSSRDNCSEM